MRSDKEEWRLIFYRHDNDELIESRPLGFCPLPRFGDSIILNGIVWEVMTVCTDYDKSYVNVYIQED